MRITAKAVAWGLVALVAAGVLAAVAGTVAVEELVDAPFLERTFNDALGPATGGRYRVGIDDVDVEPWRGNLSVEGIRLRPADFGTGGPEQVERALRFSGDVDRVAIEGVRLWQLIRHRDLVATAFEVDAPRLAVIVVERETPAVQGATGAAAGSTESVAEPESEGAAVAGEEAPDSTGDGPESVMERLPRIHLDRVAIRDVDATVVTLRRRDAGRGEAPLTDRVRGLGLTFTDLHIDPNRPPDPDHFLFAHDVRLSFDGMNLGDRDGVTVALGRLEASTEARSVRLSGMELVPSHSREDYLAGQGPGGDRVELSTGPVQVAGLQWHSLLDHLEALADSVTVDSLRIHVLSDKHRPRGPPSGVPVMPHDIIRELAVGLTVDVVEVRHGTVTYAERGPESQRPGSVTFADINARFTNVTNDPLQAAGGGPTLVEATTRLFDAAPVTVQASVPLLGPPPSMFFFATVGPFPATAVNAILPDLEGIRVTEGAVDSARVDIRYGPSGARGGVMVGYRGLSIRQEDRNTGGQSLGQRLTSFVANTFVIRGDNQPDDDRGPRVGRVEYERPPEAPFFRIFWEAIRDGLIDVAKR